MIKYYSIARPVSIGTAPKLNEAVQIVNFTKRQYVKEIDREAWGFITYNEPIENPGDWDLVCEAKLLKAVDIKWDADAEDLEFLPTEIVIPRYITDEDAISDYISDFTGFCHEGFTLVNVYN